MSHNGGNEYDNTQIVKELVGLEPEVNILKIEEVKKKWINGKNNLCIK